MKVIFSMDAEYSMSRVGGGLVRLFNTKRYLQKEGVEVDLLDQWRTELEQYDIFHHFGATKSGLGVLNHVKKMKHMRKQRIKIIVNPIFWVDFRSAYSQAANSITRRAKNVLIYAGLRTSPSFFYPLNMIRKVLLSADLLLTTSYAEIEQLTRYFGIPKDRFSVVYSGVEPRFLDADPNLFVNEFGVSDFILVAGHFYARKGQLPFIRSMKGVDIPIVFVGKKHGSDPWYYDKCKSEATANMLFIDSIDYSSPLLPSCYAAANTFALPSMAETPGLAALEAGLAGAKVVITAYGCTREYFKDYATYIVPNRIAKMRQAVIETYRKKTDSELRDHILENHLCKHMARKTKEAYEHILERGIG